MATNRQRDLFFKDYKKGDEISLFCYNMSQQIIKEKTSYLYYGNFKFKQFGGLDKLIHIIVAYLKETHNYTLEKIYLRGYKVKAIAEEDKIL